MHLSCSERNFRSADTGWRSEGERTQWAWELLRDDSDSVWDYLPSPCFWGSGTSSHPGRMISIGQGMDCSFRIPLALWLNGIWRIWAVPIDWMNELAASQNRAVINFVAVSAPSSNLTSVAWQRSHFLSVPLKFQPQWFYFLVFEVSWTALYSR